jgi:tetratricopeptide (TPR) repeat protein
MARKTNNTSESFDGWQLFGAEAQYAESIFRNALGDIEAAIAAAQRVLEIKPDYAPAILTMGSIEYQRGREAKGRRLFHSLLSLPDEFGDLWQVIDKAGNFLIQRKKYREALEIYNWRSIKELFRGFPIAQSFTKGSVVARDTKGCLMKPWRRRARRWTLSLIVRI